jgi:spore coat protein U-like protein
MMTRLMQPSVAMIALIAGIATTAAGQSNSASVTATAVVQQPINVVGAANLTFGNVFPGVNATVPLTGAGAGRFDVSGQASAPVNLAFTALPTDLTLLSNNLPVSFTAGYNAANSAAGATPFAPGSGAAASLSGTGTLFVFLGGTVTPAVNQVAGTYTGTVTLQVTY